MNNACKNENVYNEVQSWKQITPFTHDDLSDLFRKKYNKEILDYNKNKKLIPQDKQLIRENSNQPIHDYPLMNESPHITMDCNIFT